MANTHPNSEIMIRTGDPAPDLRLQNSDGVYLRLSDALNDGPLVLLFYRGDW